MTLIIKLQDDFEVRKTNVVSVEYGKEDEFLGKILHYTQADGKVGGFKTNRIKDFEVK